MSWVDSLLLQHKILKEQVITEEQTSRITKDWLMITDIEDISEKLKEITELVLVFTEKNNKFKFWIMNYE